jgi:hypothetical protein
MPITRAVFITVPNVMISHTKRHRLNSKLPKGFAETPAGELAVRVPPYSADLRRLLKTRSYNAGRRPMNRGGSGQMEW